MRLVDLIGIHLEASSGAPVLLLREHDAPHRVLPIFVGGAEAASIALAVSGETPVRPLTHDVMAALVESLDARIDAAEVTELRDGAFLAHLAVTGPGGELRLDSRPSDAIALAVRLKAPVYVSEEVLDEAGAVVPEQPAAEDIDAEVERFRGFLDELDPADFSEEAQPGPAPEPDREVGDPGD